MENSQKLLLAVALIAATSTILMTGDNNLSSNLRPSESNINSEFQKFVQDFGVKFNSEEEARYRQSVFEENLKYIKEFNAKNSGMELGINQFAIYTNEEFKNRFLNKEQHHRKLEQMDTTEDFHKSHAEIVADVTKQPMPSNWNWLNFGAVTSPMSQGQCGSSWAFSAKDGLESLYYITKGTLQTLSAQQILDCEPHGKGCMGGNPGNAWLYTKTDGIQSENSYKYVGKNQECMHNAADVVFMNEKSMRVKPQTPAAAMKYVIQQPLSVGVDASSQAFQFYKGGVISGTECQQNINLAVTLVGYNDVVNNPYWIIKNNWGTGWGESGFARLAKTVDFVEELGTCGILVDPAFPSGVVMPGKN